MLKKLKLGANLALTAFFILAVFVNTPNLNPLYPDGAFTWCFVISAYLAVNFIIGLGAVKIYQDEMGRVHFDVDKSRKSVKISFTVLAVIWGAYFIINVLSMPLFNYVAYRDQLGESEVSDFTDDVQILDINELPIVDQSLAYELADKKLGENPGMGSQVTLGEPVIQEVNGALVWVVPLEHSGFFKWFSNMEGSAGYIVVSATDTRDVTFVGDYLIKYQPNSYLFDDLTRHLRLFGGALFEGITDYSFELDDDGKPHWIITTYSYEWLYALPEATGVFIVDATTGETHQYTVDTVPDWVDRVQPEDFIMNQIYNQGQYVHGIFNFSNLDKFMTSSGNIIVYNSGNCYLFTGLTSVGADESAIGFIMVDMVTKESKVYQISGATESAAQVSAEGKVQQYSYNASFPMIINLDGSPTYFMTLKDNAGLIKQYAFVSVSDYSSVGVGETVTDAMTNFRQVLRSSGASITTGGETTTYTGTILRIEPEIIGSNTSYKMILEEYPSIIFTSTYDISDELALTRDGDTVEITFNLIDSFVISITEFDNKTIN